MNMQFMKLYNLHIYEFIDAHTIYISLWIIHKITITKLNLHSKQFNTHTHTHIYNELEHYEIKYIMQYEIIWTISLGKKIIVMNMKLHNF